MLVEAGRVIAQKYRLERPLAKGGMGSIWIARHLLLDVAVAVKFMDPSFAVHGELRARFEREAKASAQMKSPHVVQVHDYGVEGGTAYMVMELLEGEDLAARLERVRRLSLQDTAAILSQVCKGLRRAHEVGIVHRDLKPGNIFLARHHEEEIVKVLDFGIAKDIGVTASGTATTTGALMGSPFYMSPEQIRRASQVDHRSDLWSVGVILYECLTGSVPFEGREIGDTLVAICTEPVTPPSRIAPFLPLEVDRFFERALARDPAHRFQTARELAMVFAALAGVHASGADLSAFRPSEPPVPVRASGADLSAFRPSQPPAEAVVMGRTSQPSHPRVILTEVAAANSMSGGAPLPWAQAGGAAAGNGALAPAGRGVTAPGRRGAPAAAVAVAALGTLLVLALGGLFVFRLVTAGSGPSAGELPSAVVEPPSGEKAPAAARAGGAGAPTTVAMDAPPVASAAQPSARSSSALPVPPAAAGAPSGRRTNAAPAPTSAVFGF